ncbi:MurR/RpiR family transcriptional regulator [Alkalibacter saccharofermentans]|uniref:Transcriptional regulator, RpiR family n=1 Tax=Alkalibacter saccharofermentans DSM 14828 TaxID=1120975 RepID=A0A1M4UXF7_9FIRM|nr:SIS domain-containing protein [Alkalibacter saccharofermentans]SHE61330.1 transcriptional regulator, RpiR family [Alkalibacter saccharofermentans DSM 14828]
MIHIDFKALNALEQEIHNKLKEHSKNFDTIKITEAAKLCECSISKISKFVKKLGFVNYKQYMDFLHGREMSSFNKSDELNRVQKFIEDFDENKVNELIALIENHDKIVIFGYGPSLICAQYFEYRLRTCTNKVIVAVSDEISISSMANESDLVLLLTVTGTFNTFENIYETAKLKGAKVAILLEEYNANLFDQCDRIFWLSKYNQPNELLPYEKSRTIFFIFLEEVVQKLMYKNKSH